MSQKDEFIIMFKAEAEEYVTKLEKGLVDLEKNPGNTELVKELNRVAHTLKGAARVFAFKDIQDVTHRIETIFEKVHNKQLTFTPLIADKIFKGMDLVKSIVNNIGKGGIVAVDVPGVCQGLDECLPAGNVLPAKAAPPAPAAPVAAAEPAAEALAVKPEASKTEAAGHAADVEEYVRMPLSRVNKLLNLIGEMVINKMTATAKITRAKKMTVLSKNSQSLLYVLEETLRKNPSVSDDVYKLLSRCNAEARKVRELSLTLWETASIEAFHLNPVIDELQSSMKELRMLPLATIFEGLPRMVRDIAREKGKEVDLVITGAETQLDKKVLEGLKASLVHVLRNAVDHGIEMPETRKSLGKPSAGTIKMSAFHEGGSVVIRIEDDGQGIDPERIRQSVLRKGIIPADELVKMTDKEIVNIIFMNGFSTSPIITDISGRGIGLDIVRRDIEQLKGKIFLTSKPGEGTTFSLILPLTIAIIQVLLVRVRDLIFAIPVPSIAESLSVEKNDLSTMEGRMAISIRGHSLPLARLSDTLGIPSHAKEDESAGRTFAGKMPVVIVSSLDKKVGFIVDQIVGEEEVFIKGLGAHLGKVKNVSGATVRSMGDVVVILDVEDLLSHSSLGHPAAMVRKASHVGKVIKKRVLVCDDAFSTRELVKSLIEAVGYSVDTAVDGLDGWERLSKAKYDLVVTDVEMPRMTGFELCDQIKKSQGFADIPVVLVTALDKPQDKKYGIDVGASAYIVKTSFDQSSLLDTIKRLIG